MSVLVNGFVLGWSVAWPPGPVNAEMIRCGLMPKHRGGGFWSAWPIGLGACTGDFMWALSVSLGAGALLNSPSIRHALAGAVVLGAVSWTLVLCAALKLGARIFSRPEWQIMTEALTSAVMLWFAV